MSANRVVWNCVILLVTGLPGVTEAAEPLRADRACHGSVLIVGDSPDEMPSLRGMLIKEGFVVQQYAQEDMPLELVGKDAVIVYIHSVIRPEVEKALLNYLRGGGRMLVLHHGIASAKVSNPAWLDTMGIAILPRDHAEYPWKVSGLVTFTMVNLSPGHPVTTEGITYDLEIAYRSPDREGATVLPAFEIPETEVFHWQRHTDGDAKTLLFGYRMTDPETGQIRMEDTAGWFKPVERGLLFYLQPGHMDHDFRNSNFAQVIRNCLAWAPRSGECSSE